jgi:hypothetical protein
VWTNSKELLAVKAGASLITHSTSRINSIVCFVFVAFETCRHFVVSSFLERLRLAMCIKHIRQIAFFPQNHAYFV